MLLTIEPRAQPAVLTRLRSLPDVERILSAVDQTFGLSHILEITFEVNPDDVSAAYLRGLRELGITRLSMGIQSFDPGLLGFMHRAHTAEEAEKSIFIVQEAGFQSYSVDLIYGNPGQSHESLHRDLDLFLSFEPPHISAYALTIEPDTRLGKYESLGILSPADDAHVAEQMDIIASRLSENGIHRYEVSNFGRAGHEAVHNSAYWRHQSYLGVGPAAHSLMFPKPEQGPPKAFRWANPRDLKRYLKATPDTFAEPAEELSAMALAEERLLMGLRTREGVGLSELETIYVYHLSDRQLTWLHQMKAESYFEAGEVLKLAPKGFPTADRLVLELVSRY